MKYKIFLCFLLLLRWIDANVVMAEELAGKNLLWQKCDSGIDSNEITAIEVNDNEGVVFVAASGTLYKSINYGKSWERETFFDKTKGALNFIKNGRKGSKKIFIGTSYGLYLSQNSGLQWNKVLNSMDSSRKVILSLAIDQKNGYNVLAATKGGLFLSKDGGCDWRLLRTFVNEKVDAVLITEKGYYAAIDNGVYYAKKADDLWEKIYSYNRFLDDENDYDSDDDDEVARENAQEVLYADKNKVYLAYNGGTAVYDEKKNTWQDFTTEGLLTKDIKDILIYKSRLYLAAGKDIYYYDEHLLKWICSSSGITASSVFKLAVSEKEGLLFAAAKDGFYKADSRHTEEDVSLWQKDFTIDEPGIKDVRTAAMRYAEVSPEKIMWMRAAAKKSAWFPEINVGLDGDIDRIIDLDRGGTADPDFYIQGPRNKNWGWDVNLSWNLGDVIWNDDQTSIDVRSRLMVQLRNDILDEINKLYFERRRLQIELSEKSSEKNERSIFKELRLEELTASIDALTGGYFSEKIAELQE